MAGPVNAAIVSDTADVDATITTSSGITAADGVDMDFGDWLIGVNNGDQATITIDTDGDLTAVEGTTSQLIELTGATTGVAGTVTVDLPSGADGVELQMSRGTITQFTDTNITLDDITYSTATEAEAPLAESTPVVVTVVTGGTPETVSFGGTITAEDASPADATHTASFTVTFNY